MMKIESRNAEAKSANAKPGLSIEEDEILSSFDPVIEGSSFQAFSEGFTHEVALEMEEDSAIEAHASFDLAESLGKIPQKLFFRIGEVAELLGVKAYVLRFWETEFPMVHPTKSRSGQRVYRRKDVEMLLLIKHLLYVERFSIEGARKRIREAKMKPAAVAAAKKVELEKPVSAPSRGLPNEGHEALLDRIDGLKAELGVGLSSFFKY
jgi:DNA-binding transcriptional MerR regulator